MMLDINVIGKRIKELRKEKGLTQNAFAQELHVSFQAVSNWERGIAPPDLENLIRIARYFDLLVDDLLRPQRDDLFLGIDGGGTKTEFAVVSSDGYVCKHLVKGGCNPNDIGYSKMAALLSDGINEMLVGFQSVKSVFLGIAGISTGNHAKQLYNELKKRYPQLHIQIKSDSFNLFALYEEADMAVISGTGSVVFVKDGDSYRRLGGWGYLLDTAGSAYDIGLAAIREVLREEDLMQPPSSIRSLLLKKLNVATLWEHVNTIYKEGKPYIAGMASVVFDAYRAGDEKAICIIDNTAKALANWLNAGVDQYGATPVAIASGGLFEHYGDIMIHRIQTYSSVKLIVNDLPPIYGACKNACAAIDCRVSRDFYENFKRTYGGIKQ